MFMAMEWPWIYILESGCHLMGWKLPCVHNMSPVPARARGKLSVALEIEIVRILSGFVCIDDHDYDDHGDDYDHDDDNDDHDDDE